MQRLVFWLAYPFLWFLSILPFNLFYRVADVMFVLVYHVIRYRRRTVSKNLRLVFPEKDADEIARIRKKFYRHMVDMFLEMIKSISISEEQLKKRFVVTNMEEIHRIRDLDKSILLACGHYASYEWMLALQLYHPPFRGFGVYKKIANPYFDRLVKRIRARFNAVLIPTREATKRITANQKQGIRGIYAMVADQSPRLERARAWAPFMGIRVPIFTGLEKLSRDLDMAVVYLHVEKVGRGFYQASFTTISDQPKQELPYSITRRYLQELENQIREAPEYYLWTHKRWKHRGAAIAREADVLNPDEQSV